MDVVVLTVCLFWSGLRIRVGYKTNNEEKRKKKLNLDLSKSLHQIDNKFSKELIEKN